MGRYFEYSDWRLEEVCDSLRAELEVSRKPLPKKVVRHHIIIRYCVGPNVYSWGMGQSWMSHHEDFTCRKDAEDFLCRQPWLTRMGDNVWVEVGRPEKYEDKDGTTKFCHYEICEFDCEGFEDGNYHTEYTEDEAKDMAEALYCIEKARVYLREYDRATNSGSLGGGSFHESLTEALETFEKEYSEEPKIEEEED